MSEEGTSFGLNIPALIVANWISDPQRIADKIAAILNEHWPEGKGA